MVPRVEDEAIFFWWEQLEYLEYRQYFGITYCEYSQYFEVLHRGYFRTRSISGIVTVDTLCTSKYFGVLYSGYCKYWQYFVR